MGTLVLNGVLVGLLISALLSVLPDPPQPRKVPMVNVNRALKGDRWVPTHRYNCPCFGVGSKIKVSFA